ncbi:MAG: hypothetical protein ACI9W4_002076 [Rhodothermales bacterium]
MEPGQLWLRPWYSGRHSPLEAISKLLGGTGFIGPHMVQTALDRGHTVTLFNRGRTNTHLFPEVEKLVGDRNGQLDSLSGRTWDVVIDNSGYYPSHVRMSAEALRGSVVRRHRQVRRSTRNGTAGQVVAVTPLAANREKGSTASGRLRIGWCP